MADRSLWMVAVPVAAGAVLLAASALAGSKAGGPLAGASPDELPKHRRKQIWDAAPEGPRVRPKKPRRVLVWITPAHLMQKDPHKGYCLPYGTCAMQTLGEKTKAFEPVVSNDQTMLLPDNLKEFDAIILQNTSGRWTMPSDEAMKKFKALFGDDGITRDAVERTLRKGLLEYIAAGHGIMGYHFAIGGNPKWNEFHEMIGASYWGHPWHEEVGVKVEEPNHPLVAAFGGKDFRLTEEIFQFRDPYSRKKLRVLLSLDTENTNMGVKWIHRKDNDFALAWVRSYGKGRVFYTAFGHRAEIYRNPELLQFYLDAIQFICGDIEAPTAPRREPSDTGAAQDWWPGPTPPEGFVSLFDGKTLDGWEGDRRSWSVRDGAITAQTTPELRLSENNFLVWKDEVEDFELRLKFRIRNGNSGVYFRVRKRAPGEKMRDPLYGMQADFDASGEWTGVIMEYLLRGKLAERGQKVVIDERGKKKVVGSCGDPKKLLEAVKIQEWNDYRIIAKGGRVVLEINGLTMCELEDRDPRRITRGWLALQVHVGPPMLVQFKDIYLRGPSDSRRDSRRRR